MTSEDIVKQTIGFIERMKPGQQRVFPFRLSSEEKGQVRDSLRKRGVRRIGFDINPTQQGGGTSIYRPNNVKRR